MADPRFYERAGPFSLTELAAMSGSVLASGAPADASIRDVAAIGDAGPGLIVYANNAKAAQTLDGKSGIAVLAKAEHAGALASVWQLHNANPQRAFAVIASAFYPEAAQPKLGDARSDPSARIGKDVRIAPGAVIGARAEIGEGSVIGANAVINPGVLIGRHCRIGANVTIAYAILGDRVMIHPGSALGQDGFGYVSSAAGHKKIPQLGRVIIQDGVEIGAAVTIDRGALGDTIIGEGTKIDNLVQIGHNCRIGRHVIIVSQVGLSGSVTIGDFAVLGGQVGVADHMTIGVGARVAAKAGVMTDIPAGATYAGFPAVPRMRWLRQIASVTENVKNKGAKSKTGEPDD